MGLENGIIIKKNVMTNLAGLNDYFSDGIDEDGKNTELEVCYWRKCWGIRNDFVDYLRTERNVDIDDIENYILNTQDIIKLIEILEYYNKKKTWELEGRSIWSWKEFKPILRKNINDLYYLRAKMEDFPGAFAIYSYDSY